MNKILKVNNVRKQLPFFRKNLILQSTCNLQLKIIIWKITGVEDDSDNKLKKKYVYLLGTCGHDSLIKIWKVTRSKIAMIRQLSGHGGSVTFIRFSPNLPFVLASCATDSTVRIWNTVTLVIFLLSYTFFELVL